MDVTSDRLMGGMFGRMDHGTDGEPSTSVLRPGDIAMVNGRSCLFALVRRLEPRRVWLPDYLCESVVDPVIRAGVEIRPYEIGLDLHVRNPGALDEVGADDLVVLIDYFGFDLHRESIAALRSSGCHVVEDAAQALLSTYERNTADFVLFSPRKLLGVPLGGILRAKDPEVLADVDLVLPDPRFVAAATDAFARRSAYDLDGRTEWYAAYKKAEELQPVNCMRMDDASRAILEAIPGMHAIAERRRHNYARLAAALGEIAVLPELPPDVVPLGFPVRLKNRPEVCRHLYARRMFCPIHWPMDERIPAGPDATDLAGTLLTLLCDQRMTTARVDALIAEVTTCL